MSDTNVPKPRDGVEDHHFSDAAGLLNALCPRNESLWRGQPSRWIYRGQANAEWALNSRAVREDAAFSACGIKRRREPEGRKINWSERRDMMNGLLSLFRLGLNRSGLPIPIPVPKVQKWPEAQLSAHPDLDVFPLMALAQHHGLPTMLLDWTLRPRVGAYFAACQAVRSNTPSKLLAIWALERGEHGDGDPRLRFYDAPAATNPNLHAQAGLFTMHFDEDDGSLEEYLVEARLKSDAVPQLRRFTLDSDQAPRLLKLLADEGIDGASMFPGPDGVVEAIRERAHYSA